MTIRFQADWDLNQDIVTGMIRRQPLVDFKTASAAGFSGISDDQVLARAADEGRVLVTHDRNTMPRHFARFVERSRSPGVIVISQQLPVRVAIEDLLLVWQCTTAEEWIDVLDYLPL